MNKQEIIQAIQAKAGESGHTPKKRDILEVLANALDLEEVKREEFFDKASLENASYPQNIADELQKKNVYHCY